ncbi:MAG: glutamine-hydrolyzing carbamoyl-phosphate synthase small subunit [Planctomycetota bacterium]|nr:glutamine-hydrolyzing carbamoyl-phosphate synthase small subunit [Planctomycetota bacterium]
MLEDGTVFEGLGFGSSKKASGEVCFHTGMTGYQEILTDPSYTGQLVTITYPHVGNYGINEEDVESNGIQVEGFIVREHSRIHSHRQASLSLSEYLAAHDVPGISEIDTRALTRKIRQHGSLGGVLTSDPTEPLDQLTQEALEAGKMSGKDLASQVTCSEPYLFSDVEGPTILVLDFGVKTNILRGLAGYGFRIQVVPSTTPFEEIQSHAPHGVLLSNGPGDPAAVTYAISTVQRLLEHSIPTFGICLGHQILGLALGGRTFKLPFGHHGANHPVKDLQSGQVEITSQNHGFAVEEESLDSDRIRITHLNLNDGTVEGIEVIDQPCFSVQYHPEACPGPHDSEYLFERFANTVRNHARGD